MMRVRKIPEHPLYRECVEKIGEAERERIFCGHSQEHFLDVARLMYIYALEEKSSLSRELIYATALLHDLGRWEQIEKGTPHHIAGERIARIIMEECGFSADEQDAAGKAIAGHRNSESQKSSDALTRYLYRADKKSRNCFSCRALSVCDWPEEKKNLYIEY